VLLLGCTPGPYYGAPYQGNYQNQGNYQDPQPAPAPQPTPTVLDADLCARAIMAIGACDAAEQFHDPAFESVDAAWAELTVATMQCQLILAADVTFQETGQTVS
jgi:hypothetical protein